jgi:transcriptional regulator with XRE-family HTH domain
MGRQTGSNGSNALGELIAAERQRRSLTRRELAALLRRADRSLGTTDKGVERWELRGQVPQPAAMRALATALELPVDRLVALAQQQRDGEPVAAVAGDAAGMVDDERLAFALAHPHRVDHRSIDDLATLTRLYASQAQSIAPVVLLGEVAGLMRRLRWLLAGSHPAASRRRLQLLYAENATIAGRLAFWNDDRGQAQTLLKLAAEVAGEVQEHQLLALSLAFRADLHSTVPYIGTVPNNTNLALTLFDEAAGLDRPDTPPLLRSWVFGCRAEEYATLRRPLESDRDMERAHTALAAARPGLGTDQVLDIAVPDIAAAAAGLSGFEGACAIALGRAREAREAFESGLKEQSSVGRLSGLAAAHALEGDVEPAAELLTRGLEEAMARQLPTRRRRVEGVRAAFLSHAADHPAVQRFDERLRAAIG